MVNPSASECGLLDGWVSAGVPELRTEAGRSALARVQELLAAGRTELAVGTALRTDGVSPDLAAAAVAQVGLQARAVERMGPDVTDWLWTPAALEQATRPPVAARRAARVARSGARVVADLGCAAGADTIALARAGLRVIAVDLDADVLAAAEHNASVAGVSDRIEFRHADALSVDLTGVDVVMVDPARRDANGRRLMKPEQWSPTYSSVLELSARVPGLVAKLAPGIEHALLPPDSDTEWVQDGADLVEACLWTGTLSTHTGRSAVLLRADTETVVSERDLPDPVPVGAIGAYVYEPEPAVIRAGLVGVVASQVNGWLLDPAIAYICADEFVNTPLATAYHVIDEIPFAIKKMRAELQSRGYSNVVVKKRGVAVDPEQLRSSLRLKGSNGIATMLLTRTNDGPLALLVEAV